MEHQEFDLERVREIVKSHVKGLPVQREGQKINARVDESGRLITEWIAIGRVDEDLCTRIDWNIEPDGKVCYLAGIDLARPLRGRGIGAEMYGVGHRVARDLGCKVIRQNPSGFARMGGEDEETREGYLKRKFGYKRISRKDAAPEIQKRLVSRMSSFLNYLAFWKG